MKSASLLIGMNCTGQAGWAQVNGRNAISWEDKFKLDVWYVDNQSLWLDLKIIAVLLWGKSLSVKGSANQVRRRPRSLRELKAFRVVKWGNRVYKKQESKEDDFEISERLITL